MPKVIKLGIAKNNNQKIQEVEKIELLSGKGVIEDRHFQESNDARTQITLIESENIDYFNKKFNVQIPYVDFRRNIITQGIELNKFIGKKLMIGETKIEGKNLCRPCKHLQELLNHEEIIKEFIQKGGLRCEILVSGIIKVGDKIKTI
jgi:MOSC domain-containing protein YiiM